jgi:hypothetical protein
MAVRAVQGRRLSFWAFIEEIAFFHGELYPGVPRSRAP